MLLLRPNEFTQPDYSVIWKEGDQERHVGRIFHTAVALAKPAGVWVWTVEFHNRKGRKEPYQGHAESQEAAKAAFRKCWDSWTPPP